MYCAVWIDHRFLWGCVYDVKFIATHIWLYFIGWHQIIQFDFFLSFVSCFKLTHCNLNLISREAEARILCCMLSWQWTQLCLKLVVFHAYILIYSSFWSKEPIMQIALKSNPFSRFQMAFSLSSFSVCCALCVFLINQVNLQAMHHSLSSVSRKWMVT